MICRLLVPSLASSLCLSHWFCMSGCVKLDRDISQVYSFLIFLNDINCSLPFPLLGVNCELLGRHRYRVVLSIYLSGVRLPRHNDCPPIDIDWTSIRHESIGSMSNQYRFDYLCYLCCCVQSLYPLSCKAFVLPSNLAKSRDWVL